MGHVIQGCYARTYHPIDKSAETARLELARRLRDRPPLSKRAPCHSGTSPQEMVSVAGSAPATSCPPDRRAPNCATRCNALPWQRERVTSTPPPVTSSGAQARTVEINRASGACGRGGSRTRSGFYTASAFEKDGLANVPTLPFALISWRRE